jgi:GDPmannose 4,6-dehydratase
MSQKVALITGISGQDGSYLAEYLLGMGYKVYGTIRRHSMPESQDARITDIVPELNCEYADLNDYGSIARLIQKSQPDEIYNLGAQSHVRVSFDVPTYTCQTNALGMLNVLEAYRSFAPQARFYQASSSEMFGDYVDPDNFQRETTPMHPVSPYGTAKLFAYHMTRVYRASYNLFATNGILFNHESPRRGSNFVTAKVVKGAVRIKKGLDKKLVLGNLDSYRDWGHSKDYVRAMHMIINHVQPDDFVVSSMHTHSIRELCEYVFGKLDLDYHDFVVQDPKFMRPQELPYLRGDSTKAQTILGWKPSFTFETMLDDIINYWDSQF